MTAATFEKNVLAFNPFDGDFGEPADKVLSDKIVTARKPGSCAHCGCEVDKGERVRRMSAKFDGELMSYRWCALCCAAMAKCSAAEDNDDEDEDAPPAWQDYEDRANLAAKNAAKEGAA